MNRSSHFLHTKSQAILPLAPGGKLGSSDYQNEFNEGDGNGPIVLFRNGNVEMLEHIEVH